MAGLLLFRAYISKALAGDVNFSFATPRIALASRLPSVGGYSCRFAKALEMDFLPGLAPRKEKA